MPALSDISICKNVLFYIDMKIVFWYNDTINCRKDAPANAVRQRSTMKRNSFIQFEDVDLAPGFWHERYELNRRVSIESVKERFEETGRFDALRFNFMKNGRRPHIFYDSDVAKWMEAVAYLYARDRDTMRDNIALCEELIDCMERAQRPDGYLNSAHQQLTPENIFKNRGEHELYCAGHLIEAAIAYHKATGRARFLRIMERYCDCIERAFITEKTAAFTTPGHEEIELALIKLYRHTGKRRYLDMADFFLSNRAVAENEKYGPDDEPRGCQDDVDIYHLKEANGHCVRALYYLSGIADLAAETGSEQLLCNLRSVFNDITERKMYITGGVGSVYRGEAFTVPYDLPDFMAYSESCAALAMVFFCTRMREIDRDARYGHTVERVLYNSALSSTSLDGRSFFYTNPLEIALEQYGREVGLPPRKRERLPATQRVEVFGCSCCPPNINRFFAEFGSYICLIEDGHLTVEQYIPSTSHSDIGTVCIAGDYMSEGKMTVSSDDYKSDTIALRIPEWCRAPMFRQNGAAAAPQIRDGYAYFTVSGSFSIEADFAPLPVFVASDPRVRANAGRIALTRGPVVYCIEGVDNGTRLNRISVDIRAIENAVVGNTDFCGMPDITLPAFRDISTADGLYVPADSIRKEEFRARFIPYFAFANRGESDMQVWIRKA